VCMCKFECVSAYLLATHCHLCMCVCLCVCDVSLGVSLGVRLRMCVCVCVWMCKCVYLGLSWCGSRTERSTLSKTEHEAYRQKQHTAKRRVWGLITRRMKNHHGHQLCRVFAFVHGRSLEYSRQCNVAPQQNSNLDSVQGKQAWQTRANRTHAQAWAMHLHACHQLPTCFSDH